MEAQVRDVKGHWDVCTGCGRETQRAIFKWSLGDSDERDIPHRNLAKALNYQPLVICAECFAGAFINLIKDENDEIRN